MKVDILLGLQWGDEGKGKIVDVLTPRYDMIARFQGGPNAGHSLEFNGLKHVLHTIPSGIFHTEKINLVGNGVVIDPIVFRKEIEALAAMQIDPAKNMVVSRKAHLILPTHRILDAASEAAKGESRIGSTLKGIGPTYMDKTGRNGLRVGDIETPDFREKYNFLKNKHLDLIKLYHYTNFDLDTLEKEWFEGLKSLQSIPFTDSEYFVNEALAAGKRILAEGAQGTLLDIDFGSYPFVTSSNTISAGACTGLGIAPNRTGEVYGIFKAYCTRVGSGPFPTELTDETGEKIRQAGREFGATTGRPRRCGWLDIPALKYSIMVNGVTRLIMTKADVLSIFDTIPVCTAYLVNGKETGEMPYDVVGADIQPVYTELEGWSTDISAIEKMEDLPLPLVRYVEFIENITGVPVEILSVGPDRKQTMIRELHG